MLRQIIVYVQVELLHWCDMLHADPAIAIQISIGAYVLMFMLVMFHCHHKSKAWCAASDWLTRRKYIDNSKCERRITSSKAKKSFLCIESPD